MNKSRLKRSQSVETKCVPRDSGVPKKDYAAIARATKRRIVWPHIVGGAEWKWRENVRNFSIFTREAGPHASGFSVFVTGVLKGTMREIAALLAASTQHEFEDKMVAFHGKDFKHGTLIPNVATSQDDGEQLSICSATFTRRGWLRKGETSCFLEATTYDAAAQRFETYRTALPLADAVAESGKRSERLHETNSFENVVCGWRVQAEATAPGEAACARVHFFAEQLPQRGSSSSTSARSNKRELAASAVRKRMVHLARGCERLALLVRRRRLGVQVLVDLRSASPLTNPHCINCEKAIVFAKLCRVCGNAVCKECSDSYERETRRPHVRTTQIDSVRVCDPCLAQIECADYTTMTTGSLAGSAVFPNRIPTKAVGGNPKKRPQNADTVHSVLPTFVDHTRYSQYVRSRAKTSMSSTVTSSTNSSLLNRDSIRALDKLTIESVASNDTHRGRRSHTLNPTGVARSPVPDDDDNRLHALRDLDGLDKHHWDELHIICDLAAKEIGVKTSIISVVTTDHQQRVIAANKPHVLTMHTGRENACCARVVMENRPLIVPHPENDSGMSFFCGFPLLTEDTTPFGALCCLAEQRHELTESQYAAMQRLAETASKMIRLEAGKKRSTSNGVVGAP